MALVVIVFEVLAVLAGVAALLWFSAFIEARQLGPAGANLGRAEPVAETAGQMRTAA